MRRPGEYKAELWDAGNPWKEEAEQHTGKGESECEKEKEAGGLWEEKDDDTR